MDSGSLLIGTKGTLYSPNDYGASYVFLGKDANGEPLVADLASMPHCLIAGTTGSGKSVCINSIIMSIMYTQRPDMVKLILIDPKVVEMAPFKDIPHLLAPVINDSAKAVTMKAEIVGRVVGYSMECVEGDK